MTRHDMKNYLDELIALKERIEDLKGEYKEALNNVSGQLELPAKTVESVVTALYRDKTTDLLLQATSVVELLQAIQARSAQAA